MQPTYDYSKLLGRMREKHFTQAGLAKAIGISEATLNLRLNNANDFKQGEMLKIAPKDIPAYFFTHEL